jgi:signal transduction histidine kinase
VVPALVGGAIALGAIAGFFATRAAEARPTDADVDSAAAASAALLTSRLETDNRRLAAASSAIGGDPTQSDSALREELKGITPMRRQLGVVPTTSPEHAVVTVAVTNGSKSTLGGVDLAARPDVRLVLELARDRGGAGAVVVPDVDGEPAVLDVLPVFGTVVPPADIAARREQLRGYVVVLSPVAVMADLVPAGSNITVHVADGGTVLGAVGRDAAAAPPQNASAVPVSQNGVAWTVQAWATPTASALPWLVLLGGLVLAVFAAVVVESRERSLAATAAEAQARTQELALIARVGPLLQQSLALGDLLPVFVVEVGDELALDSVTISLSSDSGELVRVFTLGGSGALDEPTFESLTSLPEAVEPGRSVSVPLTRAGRVVGAFQARAVNGLTAAQVEALSAVCALLAAAIGNVKLFSDEQDMVVRLRDLDRMKTMFIGSVSHELRPSVTAIQGFATLLETDTGNIDADRRADYLERIGRNARSLAVLIEDLLDFARFERSGLTAELRPTDLSDLVPTVVDQMSSMLTGRAVDTSVAPGIVAMADTLAVERILANLLSNASKYTPPDSAVTVSLEREGDSAVLSVSDKGPGIPVEEREKVFELFYRSDAVARVTRGVGLGLALTRQLVEHLNGTITVHDAPGGGAEFRVTLPLADDAMASTGAPSDEPTHLRSGG